MHRLLSALALLLSLTLLPGAPASAAPAPAAERDGGLTVKHLAWGPLRVGMTAEQAQQTGMVSEESMGCAPGFAMAEEFTERGFVWWREVKRKQRVSQIIIRSEIDRTPKGLGVGSTLGELRKAYPRLTKVTSYAKLYDQHRSKKDFWVVSLRKRGSHVNFQFPFGRRPKASTRVESIVLARKQTIYPGC